jgi:hypothetical protein
MHASINRNIDQKVAPGESMNLTNIDFELFFQSLYIKANHNRDTIRFKGKAMTKTGKFPKKICNTRESARYMASTMYGISMWSFRKNSNSEP